jgi:hypothetical protein
MRISRASTVVTTAPPNTTAGPSHVSYIGHRGNDVVIGTLNGEQSRGAVIGDPGQAPSAITGYLLASRMEQESDDVRLDALGSAGHCGG